MNNEQLTEEIQKLKNSTTLPLDVVESMRIRLRDNDGFAVKSELPTIVTDSTLASSIFQAPRGAITAPSGGATIDSQARTAINAIITALEELGLVTPN